jgi:hypothetical protein
MPVSHSVDPPPRFFRGRFFCERVRPGWRGRGGQGHDWSESSRVHDGVYALTLDRETKHQQEIINTIIIIIYDHHHHMLELLMTGCCI